MAGHFIKPLVDARQQHLLNEYGVCANKTHVQVLDEEGKLAHSKSYMWLYRSDEISEQTNKQKLTLEEQYKLWQKNHSHLR